MPPRNICNPLPERHTVQDLVCERMSDTQPSPLADFHSCQAEEASNSSAAEGSAEQGAGGSAVQGASGTVDADAAEQPPDLAPSESTQCTTELNGLPPSDGSDGIRELGVLGATEGGTLAGAKKAGGTARTAGAGSGTARTPGTARGAAVTEGTGTGAAGGTAGGTAESLGAGTRASGPVTAGAPEPAGMPAAGSWAEVEIETEVTVLQRRAAAQANSHK